MGNFEKHHSPLPYGAVIEVELPPGIDRRPRMLSGLCNHLSRPMMLDTRAEGVRLGFSVNQSAIEAAWEEVEQVTGSVLSVLGLPRSAVIMQVLMER